MTDILLAAQSIFTLMLSAVMGALSLFNAVEGQTVVAASFAAIGFVLFAHGAYEGATYKNKKRGEKQ